MKYHETTFDDYISSNFKINFHNELENIIKKIPENKNNVGNIIIYGPSGVGKYTQALRIIKKYSPSDLKYEKKMFLNSDKYNYCYKISDIHYEIDMNLLGCNSKLIWHDIFLQIVDIISISSHKFGIILCKNFHNIHPELLPIFYSYIQQYNNIQLPFQIHYILLTEQISFISNNILNNIKIINVKRPNNEIYEYLKIPSIIDKKCILNLKESNLLKKTKNIDDLPEETFDIICDILIKKIKNNKKISLIEFRELLYDTLIYNLDFNEILWEIITHFTLHNNISEENLKKILIDLHTQIKQYNNNYRPIYHLENMLLNIINNITI